MRTGGEEFYVPRLPIGRDEEIESPLEFFGDTSKWKPTANEIAEYELGGEDNANWRRWRKRRARRIVVASRCAPTADEIESVLAFDPRDPQCREDNRRQEERLLIQDILARDDEAEITPEAIAAERESQQERQRIWDMEWAASDRAARAGTEPGMDAFGVLKIQAVYDLAGALDMADAYGLSADEILQLRAAASPWSAARAERRRIRAKAQAAAAKAESEGAQATETSAGPKADTSTVEPLEALTLVPGIVGDIVDWIERSAMRPNRILALGTALTVVGTVLGRTVAGPTRSGTHLYVIGLSRTAGGKQHIINCAKKLLTAIKAHHHIGPGEFVSMQGAINALTDMPLILCLQDEFGSFLRRINSKKASNFESQITKFMREAWGLSFESYQTPEAAWRKSVTVHAPALSLYGLSTREEFYTSLQSGDLPNGFLNRFIVLSSDKRMPEQDPDPGSLQVPEYIAEYLTALYKWRGRELDVAHLSNPEYGPEPDVRPWANATASAIYKEFRRENDDRTDREPGIENFIGRYSDTNSRSE